MSYQLSKRRRQDQSSVHRARACLEAVDLLAAVEEPDGVVEDAVGGEVVGVGRARDEDERQVCVIA